MAKKKKLVNSNVNTNPNPHLVRMVANFGDIMKLGYSEENWTEASRLLKDISLTVSQETMSELGSLWSESYVNNDFVFVDSKINRIMETLSPR